ncbi:MULTISPECIES: DUF368 domain-containing protein [Halomonas]|uniref:DUF368 domain-containing protein n=1 Tax=Halomonas TaxID=2745 RepID=UPI00055815B4|nr:MULTISPECIES: DUF368 domain-containing protein [Halomonas]MDR5888846.1 DUF368 domain-containing protein [Halomonas salina]WJY08025.1 DUF368 domain-containing protein [Halomonas halophila]
MKRQLGLLFRGAGMGAADAVPGVSGGTIAFITGIYEELLLTVRRFGPSAFGAWRQGGMAGLIAHLNLGFLVPLLAGIAASLISVAHLVVWLMEDHPLLLNGFFFGLVAASALVVGRHPADWRFWHLLPLAIGLLLAQLLPALMPLIGRLGSPELMLVVGGAIAISAMLLPGVSGSFLLLTMGLYGKVMDAIRDVDLGAILLFGGGCLIGLFAFSRLLCWLLLRFHTATLQLLVGFILGSLPVLWPWRELVSYQLGPDGQMIPLDYRYLTPSAFTEVTGDPAHLLGVAALMLAGAALVWSIGRTQNGDQTVAPGGRHENKEEGSDA